MNFLVRAFPAWASISSQASTESVPQKQSAGGSISTSLPGQDAPHVRDAHAGRWREYRLGGHAARPRVNRDGDPARQDGSAASRLLADQAHGRLMVTIWDPGLFGGYGMIP
jgi:hypothetical protein